MSKVRELKLSSGAVATIIDADSSRAVRASCIRVAIDYVYASGDAVLVSLSDDDDVVISHISLTRKQLLDLMERLVTQAEFLREPSRVGRA